jgi:Glyoxalase/Bleomycin resistance protein/Dioxygenase superfamily.
MVFASGSSTGLPALRDSMAGVTTEFEPALVPELLVSDVGTSLEFWCTICGFEVRYDRPDEGFAYITRGSAHVMLEQSGVDRDWITAELQAPRGRGINFQITVPDVESIVSALRAAGVELFMQPETKWYRVGEEEAGVRQFLVTDPDGYLIRFQSSFGRRLTAR